MSMRQSGRWMRLADDRVLEYLDEQGWGSPELIARECRWDVPESIVRERLRNLAQVEFVAPIAEGSDCYEITTWGRCYLEGDLDAEHHAPRQIRHGHNWIIRV